MSRNRNRHHDATETTPAAAEQTTGMEVAQVASEQPTPAAEPTGTEVAQDAAPAAEQPAADATPEAEAKTVPVTRYRLVAADTYRAPRGLATAMLKQFRLTPVATVDEVTAALLASGDYMQVAPQAATLRPRKPVAWQCRQWVKGAVLEVVADEQPAAADAQ